MKTKAFTLVESVVAMGILSFSIIAVVGTLTTGLRIMAMSRDSQQVTQLLVDKTETIRLVSFDQLASLPPAFKQGKFEGVTAVKPVSFSDKIKQVSFSISWETLGIPRSRTWTTFVAKQGLFGYVY